MANTTTLDEELLSGLQQARKKKPRNFCLIAKGPEVVKLIVQKKKINEGMAQKAKAEAKGNLVILGVVIGEGIELSFEVTGEEPSLNPKKIKDYISEQTELTVKPKWVVVTELREAEETEGEGEELAAPEPPTAPPPPTDSAAPPKAPPPPGDLLAELVAKMNKLSPVIQAAAQANPTRKAELLKPVAEFQAQVKAKDAGRAQESLKTLAALLKELGTGSAAPPKTSASEVPPAPPPLQSKQESEQREAEGEDKSEADAKADEFRKNWAAARKSLRLAIDKVEGQLMGLAEALLKSDDPNMVWVAEEGLTQLVSGLRASATTIDKSASKNPAKAAAFARPALAELEKRLDSQQVKVCDQNKFGVKVSVKSTIEQAIAELVKTLETAA